MIGSSGNAFCSGHDLKEIQSYKKKEDAEELFRKCSKVMMSLNKLPQPVIAMVQGVATAAGCQLVASCDLAIASEDARFGVSGINAGLFCSTPAVALSRNIGRKQAFHMLVTGDLICAQEALQYGLINKVAPSAMLEEETMNLATKIASKPDFSIRLGKKMFYEQLKYNHLEDAYAFATERIVCNIEHPDAKRGIDAFVTKKNPQT